MTENHPYSITNALPCYSQHYVHLEGKGRLAMDLGRHPVRPLRRAGTLSSVAGGGPGGRKFGETKQ